MDNLSNKIFKSKSTISKYEKNEIIIDISTLLDICNALDCSIYDILYFPENNKLTKSFMNPFNCEKLYMYYITGKKIIKSVIELSTSNDVVMVKLFNAVKDISKYASVYSYKYEGNLSYSNTIAYISLSNHKNASLIENVNIIINFPWSDNQDIFSAFLTGLTPNCLPVVKKCIISKKEIQNIDLYKNDLIISSEDLNSISNNNAWILENPNHSHFILDF